MLSPGSLGDPWAPQTPAAPEPLSFILTTHGAPEELQGLLYAVAFGEEAEAYD